MDELKACPFCGSSNTTLDYYEISCPQELGTIVVCNDCGASAKSIVDWNTRPIEDELHARIARLEAALTNARELVGMTPPPAFPEWIPVGDRLPFGGKVLVLWKDRTIHLDWTFLDGGGYYWWNSGQSNVTHWMPLPQPPEVQE